MQALPTTDWRERTLMQDGSTVAQGHPAASSQWLSFRLSTILSMTLLSSHRTVPTTSISLPIPIPSPTWPFHLELFWLQCHSGFWPPTAWEPDFCLPASWESEGTLHGNLAGSNSRVPTYAPRHRGSTVLTLRSSGGILEYSLVARALSLSLSARIAHLMSTIPNPESRQKIPPTITDTPRPLQRAFQGTQWLKGYQSRKGAMAPKHELTPVGQTRKQGTFLQKPRAPRLAPTEYLQ